MKAQTITAPLGLKNEGSRDTLRSPHSFIEKFWSVRDAAEYTGYAVGTLYNLVSRNLIPHRKKRGKLYFVPSEVQNWIEEGNLE